MTLIFVRIVLRKGHDHWGMEVNGRPRRLTPLVLVRNAVPQPANPLKSQRKAFQPSGRAFAKWSRRLLLCSWPVLTRANESELGFAVASRAFGDRSPPQIRSQMLDGIWRWHPVGTAPEAVNNARGERSFPRSAGLSGPGPTASCHERASGTESLCRYRGQSGHQGRGWRLTAFGQFKPFPTMVGAATQPSLSGHSPHFLAFHARISGTRGCSCVPPPDRETPDCD